MGFYYATTPELMEIEGLISTGKMITNLEKDEAVEFIISMVRSAYTGDLE